MSIARPEYVPRSFETARLAIRCPMPGDGAALYAAVTESLAELRPWLAQYCTAPTPAQSEAEVRERHDQFIAGQVFSWLLFLKGTNTLVGSSDLYDISWSVLEFAIGYWVRTSFAGRGYITEAVAGVVDFAFHVLGARRLIIRCDALNERSAAVPRRLGFKHQTTLLYDRWNDFAGEPRDTMVFVKGAPPK